MRKKSNDKPRANSLGERISILEERVTRLERGDRKSVEETRESVPLCSEVEQLRVRMKRAITQSGLSYAEIGQRMGAGSSKEAKNKVWWLVNNSTNPSVFDVMKFCEAVSVEVSDLLQLES